MMGKTKKTIEGHFVKKRKDCFEDFNITYEGNNSILYGKIKDEAHMQGILNKIRDLNPKHISINTAQK